VFKVNECFIETRLSTPVTTGMNVTMATMQIRMRMKKHRKPMMDQHCMWRTEGIVLESVKMGHSISDMQNIIMVKQMQWQAMYPKP